MEVLQIVCSVNSDSSETQWLLKEVILSLVQTATTG